MELSWNDRRTRQFLTNEISADENIKPLVYHNGRYWRLDDNNKIPRPSQELLDKVEEIAKKYVKV
jgi:hypothetical protein